jgi:hypothetical protein
LAPGSFALRDGAKLFIRRFRRLAQIIVWGGLFGAGGVLPHATARSFFIRRWRRFSQIIVWVGCLAPRSRDGAKLFYPQISQILADYCLGWTVWRRRWRRLAQIIVWVAVWHRDHATVRSFFIRRLRRFSQIIVWVAVWRRGSFALRDGAKLYYPRSAQEDGQEYQREAEDKDKPQSAPAIPGAGGGGCASVAGTRLLSVLCGPAKRRAGIEQRGEGLLTGAFTHNLNDFLTGDFTLLEFLTEFVIRWIINHNLLVFNGLVDCPSPFGIQCCVLRTGCRRLCARKQALKWLMAPR